MSDDLVKRARSISKGEGYPSTTTVYNSFVGELADRIEALERENRLYRIMVEDCDRQRKTQYARANAAEAALAAMRRERDAKRDEARLWELRCGVARTCAEAAEAALAAMTVERDISNELGRALEEDAGQLRERLAKAVEALRTTTQILSQCLFETILVKGQYLDRKEVVTSARATLAEMGDMTDE